MEKFSLQDTQDVEAVENLIAWLRGQDFGPTKGVTIMAAAIVVGVMSIAKEQKWGKARSWTALVAVADSILETYEDILMAGRDKAKEKSREAKDNAN